MTTPIEFGSLDPVVVARAITFRRAIISLLIIFHLTAVFLWVSLPPQFLQEYKQGVVAPYLLFTGCWQNWSMFSPNPSNDDSYIQARITYKDGATHLWYLPRNRTPMFFALCERERFRKIAENASSDTSNKLWEGIAIYCARQNYMSVLNPPIQVTMIRHRRWIMPMGVAAQPYSATDFYGIPITASDLK